MIGAKVNLDGKSLPRGWSIERLGDVGEYINGYPFKPDDWKDSGLPIIRIQNLNDPSKPYNYHPARIDERYLVKNGDILISWSASLGTFLWRGGDAWLNQHIFKATPNELKIDRRFFYWAMVYAIDRIAKNARGSTMVHVTGKEFKGSEILVPTKFEQRKIADLLDVVQRAIEEQEQLIKLSRALKKSLLRQLFSQGLLGEKQKESEIGLVPKSWEVVPLGNIAKIGNGSTPKRDNKAYWQGGKIPWLNSAKIHERFITKADQFVTDIAVKECHLPYVKPGSLLIAITGQGKTLGNSALVSFETCINQHLAYAQFVPSKIVPEFVLWFMQTRYEHLRSISQAGGSTKGALTCGYLKTYPVPVPSLDEQREIARVFTVIDRKEKVHERKHVALTALFRTLLHQLMTAELRVGRVELSQLQPVAAE